MTDRETRNSRGFGYVVFTTEEDAKDAMQTMAGERGKVRVCIFFFKFLSCRCPQFIPSRQTADIFHKKIILIT